MALLPANRIGVRGRTRHDGRQRNRGATLRLRSFRGSGSSPSRASIAGWCRRRRCASISASAWPTASPCSGSRCRAPSSVPTARPCRSAPQAPSPSARSPLGTLKALFATDCNWSQFDLGWMFTFFFLLLGISAAIWGGWLERVGPRKAGLVSALCWCGAAC